MLIPLWVNSTMALLGGGKGRIWSLVGEEETHSWWLYLSLDLSTLPLSLLPNHHDVQRCPARPTVVNGHYEL